MADSTVAALSAIASVDGTELLYLVDDPSGTPLDRKVTVTDLLAAASGRLIGFTSYTPGSDTQVLNAGGSTSLADVDATNLQVTFTAPASGKVVVHLTAMADSVTNGIVRWGLRESTTQVGNTRWMWSTAGTTLGTRTTTGKFYVSGLTAGSSHTYKWAYYVASGTTMSIWGGPSYGDCVMEVFSVA